MFFPDVKEDSNMDDGMGGAFEDARLKIFSTKKAMENPGFMSCILIILYKRGLYMWLW